MVMDRWLSGRVETISPEMVDEALGELESETEELQSLVKQGKHWDAYIRFASCISFMNNAAQQQSSKLPAIIQRVLSWIQKIKAVIDSIVKGIIGANGYSIGVSPPFGVSVSISFPV